VIDYYTTDSVLECITPRCVSQTCLSADFWRGSDTETVNVFVETVVGILGAVSKYTYTGYWTPYIPKMQHIMWATSNAQVYVVPYALYLQNVTITVGGGIADVGYDNSLNSETMTWGSAYTLYFRPPGDIPSGFVNLSLVVSGVGSALTFPNRRPAVFSSDITYAFNYNYAASLGGIPYSVCLFPVITGVSPSVGSMGGGTVVTIAGYGFSSNLTQMVVFADGLPCIVSYSDSESIICRTSALALPSSSLSRLRRRQSVDVNNTRGLGSAGAWVRLWTGTCGLSCASSAIKASFAWRKGFFFSLYTELGSSSINWTPIFGLSSATFTADISTIITAPYSGLYTFYASVDDVLLGLYGCAMTNSYSCEPGGSNENLLISISSYAPIVGDYFYTNGQNSSSIRLFRGQKYTLRARTASSSFYMTIVMTCLLDEQRWQQGFHGSSCKNTTRLY